METGIILLKTYLLTYCVLVKLTLLRYTDTTEFPMNEETMKRTLCGLNLVVKIRSPIQIQIQSPTQENVYGRYLKERRCGVTRWKTTQSLKQKQYSATPPYLESSNTNKSNQNSCLICSNLVSQSEFVSEAL